MADDSAGGGFIDSITKGVFGGEQQLKSAADTAQHYLDMAKAGEWAIDEETGTHLRSAFAYALQQLEEIKRRTHYLKVAPKVGNDTYAQQVSQHMLASVDSDDQSLLPMFNSLEDSLAKWREAVDTAIQHYNAADEAATKHFGRFKD